jgi:hypothetical protein
VPKQTDGLGYIRGGGAPDPRKAPPFMLSYARPTRGTAADLEPVKQLFDDLHQEVGFISADLKDAESAGFDQEMPLGVLWQRRLSYYLANCRVLVALTSAPFFESDWCGKEWWVFTQRKVVVSAPLKQDEFPLVPVVWVPMSGGMHPVAKRLQYTNRHLPHSYARDGLLALSRRGGTDYRVAVNHIATRICELMEHTAIESGRLVKIESAPNAFKAHRLQPNYQGVQIWHDEGPEPAAEPE